MKPSNLFMDRKINKRLNDILIAISEIESFLEQRPREFQVFVEDHMFRNAIERQVGIIGEAVAQILQVDPNIQISEARDIRATRNFLIHSYDTIRIDMIWGIVINDLPKLKLEVQALLDS